MTDRKKLRREARVHALERNIGETIFLVDAARVFDVPPSTLHKMAGEGLIDSWKEPDDSGRERRYVRIDKNFVEWAEDYNRKRPYTRSSSNEEADPDEKPAAVRPVSLFDTMAPVSAANHDVPLSKVERSIYDEFREVAAGLRVAHEKVSEADEAVADAVARYRRLEERVGPVLAALERFARPPAMKTEEVAA